MFGNDYEVRKYLQVLTELLLEKDVFTIEELERMKKKLDDYHKDQLEKYRRGEIDIKGNLI